MGVIDWVLPFLLLLGVLVVVHELGHLVVAKLLGVRCERFSVGLGPPLLRYRYGETEYLIAALPLGGYVRMTGEAPDEEVAPEELARSFYGQSPLRRTAIALGGPVMNLMLSVVVIAAMLMSAGWPVMTSRIGSVLPGSPAERAGLQSGDKIVSINGEEVKRWDEMVQKIRGAGGSPMRIEAERGS
jgi:regulator of sigma E protease